MLIVPLPITRDFIRANPDWTFVYSTNVYHTSSYGQAAVAANEPNTIGIPVRFRFCRSNASSYFNDDMFNDVTKPILDKVLASIAERGGIIVVFPKIGEGDSRLKEKAPRTFQYIREELAKLHSSNVQFVW